MCQGPCASHCWLLPQISTFSSALWWKQAWIICWWRSCHAVLRPEHMNETWSPTKTGQQMMCTPASLLELEPRSLSGLVLRFYNVTDQVLNSKLSPSCSAWLWYKLKPQHAAFIYTTRITRSVVPPTETDTSQKRLLPKSPFFFATSLLVDPSAKSAVPYPAADPSSPQTQGHQGTSGNSCPLLFPTRHTSSFHQARGCKGGDFCNSRSL